MKYSLFCLFFVFIEVRSADVEDRQFDWNNIYHGRDSRRLSRRSSKELAVEKKKQKAAEQVRLLDQGGCESSYCCSCITRPLFVLWGCILKRKSRVKA